ncbi:hypothetical protein LCGC14_1864370 [marine sediment metagenome]|uniref:Uncharacterized protein n=1 Tax=marine sediment metagenome TaxID=412755 RepID=A0A0F9J5I3_9ZZZZ
MADKKKLKDMLNSIVDKNDEQAQVLFHDYLEDKMRDVLKPVVDPETEVVDDEDSTKKD